MAGTPPTLIAFQPNATASPPFSRSVTLDGQSYVLAVAWLAYRGDWYMSLTDQNGTLIIYQPLVGSPQDADIPLAPGLFTTSKLLYRPGSGNFEITP